jgi:hypothetical protein
MATGTCDQVEVIGAGRRVTVEISEPGMSIQTEMTVRQCDRFIAALQSARKAAS